MNAAASEGKIGSALVTALVFAVLGPPLGGIIVGIWPFGAFLLYQPIALAQQAGGGVPHMLLAILKKIILLWAFILGQSYVYGGLAALIVGLALATVVLLRSTFSNLIAGTTAALAVPLAALATALVSGQPASAIVPVVVYSSTIQCLPAVLAALLCRKLLVSWHIINVAEKGASR